MSESSNPNVIVTNRLRLRPLLSTDGDAIYTLFSNPQVAASCPVHKRVGTKAEFEVWLKGMMEGGKCVIHCVELQVSSQHDGKKTEAKKQKSNQNEGKAPNSADKSQGESRFIGLMGAHHIPEIAYIFSPEHWGKGYATEALKAWMNWYWSAYPGKVEESAYLEAMTGPEAVSSPNVLKKCGFKWHRDIESEMMQSEEEKGKEGKKYITLDIWKVEMLRLRKDR